MSRIRNPDWENDENLKADIQKYVLQNLTRREVLDFLGRDYPQYAWSLPTLSRRMAHFGVKYVDYETDLKVVEKAVKEETSGPTDPCIKSYESNTIWQYHEAWCTMACSNSRNTGTPPEHPGIRTKIPRIPLENPKHPQNTQCSMILFLIIV